MLSMQLGTTMTVYYSSSPPGESGIIDYYVHMIRGENNRKGQLLQKKMELSKYSSPHMNTRWTQDRQKDDWKLWKQTLRFVHVFCEKCKMTIYI